MPPRRSPRSSPRPASTRRSSAPSRLRPTATRGRRTISISRRESIRAGSEEIAGALRREGFSVEVSAPDANDPLGGVLRVSAEGIDPIEIVNFCNPPAGGFPALVEIALRDAVPFREGEPLRVVTLPHLVVFKLYSGGRKAKNDVFELLNRNPDLDLNTLRELCKRFRMDRTLERWLRELQASDDE